MRKGISASIATTDDDGNGSQLKIETGVPLLEHGVEFFYFRRTTLAYKVSLDLARWLARRAADFDLLHVHALFSFSSTVAAWAARRSKVPYIVRPLGVLNRWGVENRRAIAKRVSLALIEVGIIRGAAVMHYTTERERSEAIEALPELGRAKSVILPVPVPDEAFAPASPQLFLEKHPELAGKEVVLFLSRLDSKKGLDLLLPAFRDVLRQRPKAHLAVAGSGEVVFMEKQQQLANDLGIAATVSWTGWLTGEMKQSAFAAASLFVLPSYSENFGVAAAEALAAGTAVVITEGVALAANLEKAKAARVTGISERELAEAMIELLTKPELRREIAAAGNLFAREQLSIELIGTELDKLYRSACSHH